MVSALAFTDNLMLDPSSVVTKPRIARNSTSGAVNSTAAAAQWIYERAGARVWGTEPAALRFGGETTIEHHTAAAITNNSF